MDRLVNFDGASLGEVNELQCNKVTILTAATINNDEWYEDPITIESNKGYQILNDRDGTKTLDCNNSHDYKVIVNFNFDANGDILHILKINNGCIFVLNNSTATYTYTATGIDITIASVGVNVLIENRLGVTSIFIENQQ